MARSLKQCETLKSRQVLRAVSSTLSITSHEAYEPDVQVSMSYQPKFVVQRRIAMRTLAKLRNDGTLKMIFTKYGIEGTLVK